MAAVRRSGLWAFFKEAARRERAAGIPERMALRSAYAQTRRACFQARPHSILPEWLAYPRGYRLRRHYDRQGAPLFGADGRPLPVTGPRENPAPAPSEIGAARRLYEAFTGKRMHRVTRIQLAPLPKVGLAFGQLLEIGYISFRDGRHYRHTYRGKARPLLIASSDGRQLVIAGGRSTFTDRGIEDL